MTTSTEGSAELEDLVDRHTSLDRIGSGRYECDVAGSPFWGTVTAHGGYQMALALHAMTLEVGDPIFVPRVVSQQFLLRFDAGILMFDVEVLRRGRTVVAAAARLVAGGRLVGYSSAMFARDVHEGAFVDRPAPTVRPPDRSDNGIVMPNATVQRLYEFHRRFGPESDDASEDGGWIVSKPSAVGDYRHLLIASDVWTPPLSRSLSRYRARQTLHQVTHFNGSTAAVDASELLVRHRVLAGSGGFADEEILLWDRSGQLLLSAKQTRIKTDDRLWRPHAQ